MPVASFGVFIGIDDYAFEPLTSCVNDALAMRDTLVKLGMLGREDWTVLTSPPVPDSSGIPTKETILDTLLPIYERQEPLDRLFFFYAGHGLSTRFSGHAELLRTALVPAGVKRLRNSGSSLIHFDELVERFKTRGARQQIWIVDACRNELPDANLNVTQTGWDVPKHGDARDAVPRAQAVIYAVAPLAKATANRGKHGHLTGHLLDGLMCTGPAAWGAAATFDEHKDGWVIDVNSLVDYAARRVTTTLAEGDWNRDHKVPRVWFGEQAATAIGPLRDVGPIADRPFELTVVPGEAAKAVEVSLSVRRSTIAAWPPNAAGQKVLILPERYRVSVRLARPEDEQWMAPAIPDPPVIDIRETDRFELALKRRPPSSGGGSGNGPVPGAAPGGAIDAGSIQPQASASSVGGVALEESAIPEPTIQPSLVAPVAGTVFAPTVGAAIGAAAGAAVGTAVGTPAATTNAPSSATTQLYIDAFDPGAALRMTSLQGERQQLLTNPREWISIEPGLWRIEVVIGDEVIAASEEDFAAKTRYKITPAAQVTPALAALLEEAQQPHPLATFVSSVQPSESIGPMQGAILPTLLPLLALKPLDRDKLILGGLSGPLNIPIAAPTTDAPAAIAIALEGGWSDARREHLARNVRVFAGGTAPVIWQDSRKRIMLFLRIAPRRSAGMKISVPDIGVIDVAAPSVKGYCSTASLTIWPNKKPDVMFNLFRMPPGSDNLVKAGRLSRALTIAARLFGVGSTLDQVEYDVFSMLSSGSWGEPVLGAIAWLGRWKKLQQDTRLGSNVPVQQFVNQQNAVHLFLLNTVPLLPDTRVIDAINSPADKSDAALDALLADTSLEQPVLAESVAILARRALATGRENHWSVTRFQQIEDTVFNTILTSVTT